NSRRFILNLGWVLVLFSFFVSDVILENIEMKKRRHQEVRYIHQLVDVEVDRGAGEHIGLLARQLPGANQVIDHVERRIPRQERPGHEYWNEKPAAFGQLLDVDVPRVLARGDRAQASADERPAMPA